MEAYSTLDAPELEDNFYINLVDWSSQNVLAVGLKNVTWLLKMYDDKENEAIKLSEFDSIYETFTSVQFAESGRLLSLGSSNGRTQVWDVETQAKISERLNRMDGDKIACLAWNGDSLTLGCQFGAILHWDTRTHLNDDSGVIRLAGHRINVCGLKWSPDKQQLASSGNDNAVQVWNLRRPEPCLTFTEHTACVKALDWSPHHRGLLTSGGGNSDGKIRFWDTLAGVPMQSISTNSQICNIGWSKHSNELVSAHGYNHNELITWRYPELRPVIRQPNHARHLYMAMSPDGESIVTGNDRETLQFWRVFGKKAVELENE